MAWLDCARLTLGESDSTAMGKLSSCRGALGIAISSRAFWTSGLSFIRRVRADERGAIFAVTAIAIIPLIIALGIVIDISRGYLAKSELSYVIDSAGFVAGRSFASEENFAGIWSLFDVDLKATSYGKALADTVLQTALDKVANRLTIKAEASIPTYFLHIAGIDHMIVEAETVRTPALPLTEADVDAGDQTEGLDVESLKDDGEDQISAISAAAEPGD